MGSSGDQTGLLNLITNLAGLIGGVVIAALSLWFSYKSRKTPATQALYAKQVELYDELGTHMAKVLDAYSKALGPQIKLKDTIPDDVRERLRSTILEQHSSLFTVQFRSMILLPRNVVMAIQAYTDVVAKLPEAQDIDQAAGTVVEAIWATCLAIRGAVGVDVLSEDMQSLFGLGVSKHSKTT